MPASIVKLLVEMLAPEAKNEYMTVVAEVEACLYKVKSV